MPIGHVTNGAHTRSCVSKEMSGLFDRYLGPDWWRHPEAVLRLDAMWRSWEQARLDPATGMATWLRDTADYHMGILMSAQGPFGNAQDTCDPGEPLPYTAAPVGLFDTKPSPD